MNSPSAHKYHSPPTFYFTNVQEKAIKKINAEKPWSHNESTIQTAVNITG